MFEALESRQLFSVAPLAPTAQPASEPAPAVTDAAEREFLKVTLKDVYITPIHRGGSGDGH